MTKYKNLKKGSKYIYFVGGLMFNGSYKYRFFNNQLNKWMYVFKLSNNHDYSIEAELVSFFNI